MNNRTLPQGLHDKLFKRARATYEIERTVSDLLIECGFHRIETPTLEHFEVFSDTIDTNNYQLFDKRGDLLSLRPDITSQVARVISSTRVQTPIKFSYSGKVFRSQEAMRGLENERTQAGIEIIGYPVQEAYAEAISSAKQALERSGLKDYTFEFSHAAILKTIFQQLELTSEVADDLSLHIRDKNITKLHEFTKQHPSEFDGFISRLPYLFGEAEAVLAEQVELEIERQLQTLPREEIARASIEQNGRIIVTDTVETMFDLMNLVAPEHLEIAMEDAYEYLPLVKHTGSIFLGHYTSEPIGDYYAGTNHVLPTSGTSRFYSALGVHDFIKRIQYTQYSKKAVQEASQTITNLAYSEGLAAHARAIEVRNEES